MKGSETIVPLTVAECEKLVAEGQGCTLLPQDVPAVLRALKIAEALDAHKDEAEKEFNEWKAKYDKAYDDYHAVVDPPRSLMSDRAHYYQKMRQCSVRYQEAERWLQDV